ncbi:MAG: XrtA system polysaccharide deacetylase [Acidiferrobacterales bacterium]
MAVAQPIKNALTVDVEDYFQVSAFASTINQYDWDTYESRVEQNTYRLLDIFDERGCKGTFFVLGWVAERYPRLVQEISTRGHEIGCHGYCHELVYNQNPEVFREDTLRAKNILEDIMQTPVQGYRAASYSITERSTWALDSLVELGFVYDSSIFPIHHDRYGMPGSSRHPYRVQTPDGHSIAEFPMSTVELFKWRFPVSGGGYFRLFPYALSRRALKSINNKEGRPFIFYLHPWEIDPHQPRIGSGWLSRFRHYNNLHRCEERLTRLLCDFEFTTVKDILTDLNFLERRKSTKTHGD